MSTKSQDQQGTETRKACEEKAENPEGEEEGGSPAVDNSSRQKDKHKISSLMSFLNLLQINDRLMIHWAEEKEVEEEEEKEVPQGNDDDDIKSANDDASKTIKNPSLSSPVVTPKFIPKKSDCLVKYLPSTENSEGLYWVQLLNMKGSPEVELPGFFDNIIGMELLSSVNMTRWANERKLPMWGKLPKRNAGNKKNKSQNHERTKKEKRKERRDREKRKQDVIAALSSGCLVSSSSSDAETSEDTSDSSQVDSSSITSSDASSSSYESIRSPLSPSKEKEEILSGLPQNESNSSKKKSGKKGSKKQHQPGEALVGGRPVWMRHTEVHGTSTYPIVRPPGGKPSLKMPLKLPIKASMVPGPNGGGSSKNAGAKASMVTVLPRPTDQHEVLIQKLLASMHAKINAARNSASTPSAMTGGDPSSGQRKRLTVDACIGAISKKYASTFEGVDWVKKRGFILQTIQVMEEKEKDECEVGRMATSTAAGAESNSAITTNEDIPNGSLVLHTSNTSVVASSNEILDPAHSLSGPSTIPSSSPKKPTKQAENKNGGKGKQLEREEEEDRSVSTTSSSAQSDSESDVSFSSDDQEWETIEWEEPVTIADDNQTLITVKKSEPLALVTKPPLEDDENYTNGFNCDMCWQEFGAGIAFYHHRHCDCCMACAKKLLARRRDATVGSRRRTFVNALHYGSSTRLPTRSRGEKDNKSGVKREGGAGVVGSSGKAPSQHRGYSGNALRLNQRASSTTTTTQHRHHRQEFITNASSFPSTSHQQLQQESSWIKTSILKFFTPSKAFQETQVGNMNRFVDLCYQALFHVGDTSRHTTPHSTATSSSAIFHVAILSAIVRASPRVHQKFEECGGMGAVRLWVEEAMLKKLEDQFYQLLDRVKLLRCQFRPATRHAWLLPADYKLHSVKPDCIDQWRKKEMAQEKEGKEEEIVKGGGLEWLCYNVWGGAPRTTAKRLAEDVYRKLWNNAGSSLEVGKKRMREQIGSLFPSHTVGGGPPLEEGSSFSMSRGCNDTILLDYSIMLPPRCATIPCCLSLLMAASSQLPEE